LLYTLAQDAFADFDRAATLNPSDPNYFFNRGNAYLTVRNVEQVCPSLPLCPPLLSA